MANKKSKEIKQGGHYEEKTVFILPWGAILCILANSVGPFYMGTGLAFIVLPAQILSLLLIPAYKKIKAPVFVEDKKPPKTKISKQKEKEFTKTPLFKLKHKIATKEFRKKPKQKVSFVEKLKATRESKNILTI